MRKPHWWEAEPWIPPPPLLTFAVSSKAPLPDNYFTGTVFDLYSARLIALLRDAGVRFETFPVTIIDKKTHEELTVIHKKTGETLPVDYKVFHLLEKRSRRDVRAQLSAAHLPMMFRDADYLPIVFIHEEFKSTLDREEITGCEYTPGDRYGFRSK